MSNDLFSSFPRHELVYHLYKRYTRYLGNQKTKNFFSPDYSICDISVQLTIFSVKKTFSVILFGNYYCCIPMIIAQNDKKTVFLALFFFFFFKIICDISILSVFSVRNTFLPQFRHIYALLNSSGVILTPACSFSSNFSSWYMSNLFNHLCFQLRNDSSCILNS